MESNEGAAQPGIDIIPEKRAELRTRPTIAIGVLIVALGMVLLIYDFSEVIFAHGHRATALAVIPTQTRITQVERKLNEAGYLTLYIEGPPAALQISSLRRHPLTAQLLHKILPKSPPDRWLRNTMSERTRFFVVADNQDFVRRTSDGIPEVYFVAPGQVEGIGGF